jgi:hypothetical protein
MFSRTILSNLNAWRNDLHRKPLILRGARQVGKTTVVDEFGKTFDHYIKLNLDQKDDSGYFAMNVPLADIVKLIFLRKGISKDGGSTLIFLDEIQESPEAMAALRYFYEELPDIHVIAAGSLLENKVDVQASFPVGRVQYKAVRPFSFREFLSALGRNDLLAVLDDVRFTAPFHQQLMLLFNVYTTLGGMPEVVSRYVETQSLTHSSVVDVFRTLITGYRDDVDKYVRGRKLTEVSRFILDSGWSFAGEAITLGRFADSEYRAKDVSEAFGVLQKAMLLELVYPTLSSKLPAIPALKRSPKLIWFDTGLVNFESGIQQEVIGANDILDVWRGRIAEQVVGQELLTLSDDILEKRKFWVRGNNSPAEVDFLFTYKSRLYPIEVKNGHNSHLKSLHSFLDQSGMDVAIRVWSSEYSVNDLTTVAGQRFRLINLPFYLVGDLPKIIDANV